MHFITWEDHLSVGVKQFDEEHHQLINLVNNLNNALKVGSTEKTMEDILVQLVKYTIIHFNHEEELMKSQQYPHFLAHKKEHESLTTQVNDFYNRFKSGKAIFSIELMTFLKEWLVKHILGTDMAYKKFFNSSGIN